MFPEFKSADDLKTLGILRCVCPTEACDIVGDYVAQQNITDYYSWTVPPGYPTQKMNEHLALFATEVIPHYS